MARAEIGSTDPSDDPARRVADGPRVSVGYPPPGEVVTPPGVSKVVWEIVRGSSLTEVVTIEVVRDPFLTEVVS